MTDGIFKSRGAKLRQSAAVVESSYSHTKLYNIPVNTKHLYNIYTMLDQRQRRWADVV